MQDKREPTDAAAVYALAAQLPDGSFVVKIGMTSIPYGRFATLITGVPFPCAMKWAWAGSRSTAHVLESNMHRLFAHRNTAREWFHFRNDERQELWDGLSAGFFALLERLPDWKTITEEQVAAFIALRVKPARSGKKETRPFDASRRTTLHEKI